MKDEYNFSFKVIKLFLGLRNWIKFKEEIKVGGSVDEYRHGRCKEMYLLTSPVYWFKQEHGFEIATML